MLKVAKDLSLPFQYVRVDLYSVRNKVVFGEMTFFEAGGYPGYEYEWDKKIGEYWELRK